jgi:hypothetical protein
LFDLQADPAETTDVSGQHKDLKDSLIVKWNEYAKTNALHDHNGHFDSIYRRNYQVKDDE